jgi:hypothetical protein
MFCGIRVAPPLTGYRGPYSTGKWLLLIYLGFHRLLARDQGREIVCNANANRRGRLIFRGTVQNKDNERRLCHIHDKAGIHCVE